MQVREIMSRHFRTIAKQDSICDAARAMRKLDIGMLPVVDAGEVIGTVTDRDITIRATAEGADPVSTLVSSVMSNEIYTCVESDSLEQAARIMEEHQIRRLMVQNERGDFVGMLSLADLARHHEYEELSAEVLEEVSQPAIQH